MTPDQLTAYGESLESLNDTIGSFGVLGGVLLGGFLVFQIVKWAVGLRESRRNGGDRSRPITGSSGELSRSGQLISEVNKLDRHQQSHAEFMRTAVEGLNRDHAVAAELYKQIAGETGKLAEAVSMLTREITMMGEGTRAWQHSHDRDQERLEEQVRELGRKGR